MADAAEISGRLVAVFTRIHGERMTGVPILNARLCVEAAGMRDWNGDHLCVLITPWFINLVLLPGSEGQAQAWRALASGTKVLQRFPAGRFEFLSGDEGEIGPYLMCSLFSPVLEFEDQEAARVAAHAALDALFDASLDPAAPATKAAPAGEASEAATAPKSTEAPSNPSRRWFLTGKSADKEGPV